MAFDLNDSQWAGLWARGLYPYVSRGGAPLLSVVKLWVVWARARGVTLEGLGADFWVPVGQVGPLLVLGHYNPDKGLEEDALLPAWFGGRCLVERAYYDRAVEMTRKYFDSSLSAYRAPAEKFSPTKRSFESVREACDYLGSVAWCLEHEQLAVKNALVTGLGWPAGWEEAGRFLRDGGNLVDVEDVALTPDLGRVVSGALVSEYQAVCFYETDREYYLALADPSDYTFEDTLYARVGRGKKLRLVQACGAHVVAAATGVSNTPVVESGAAEVDYSVLDVKFGMNSEEMRKANPRDRAMTADLFLRWCLYQAWVQEAADIHFETAFGKGRVRLRVDSDLREIARIPMALMAGVVQLACDWAGPGTSGSQYAPGDGRFGFRLDQTVYDVRVAKCMVGVDVKFPKVTMRLLGKKVRSLDSIGFAPRTLGMLKRMIRMHQGLILLTGPTGSGKTSTSSSCLKEINTPDINIETMENPVEISIEGVNQAEVNEARGASFGALLKSILRRDPDVISVGELRDIETAETAVQAALTGHLVFATLHTNSACAAVERLISLGVEPYLLGEVLLGIGGQRLKDRLCMRCRQEIPVLEEHRRIFAAANVPLGDVLYESRGCPHCRGRGTSGRVLISELFPVTGREGRLIAGKCRGSELEEHYKGLGYLTMYQDMLRHVAEGRMSLQQTHGFSRDWILG